MKTTTMPKRKTNVLVLYVPTMPKGRTSQQLRTRIEQSMKRYNRRDGKRVCE